MRWCFQDEGYLYADGVLKQLASGQAVVPVLWQYEVSAVLTRALKNGALDAPEVSEFLDTLNQLNISVDPDSSKHILTDVHQLAITYRLSSYDASYLEVAKRRNVPLATLDKELITASKASGVTLLL